MPITRLTTKPTKLSASAVAAEVSPDLYSFIEAFLVLNPEPSDEQVHALAATIDMDHESFEEAMYAILAKVVEGYEEAQAGKLTASDPDGEAAENDGAPDLETIGEPDLLKKAAESDGAVDTEQIEELTQN